MIKAFLVALGSFILFLAIHGLRFHYFPPREKARSVLRIFLAAALTFPILFAATPADPLTDPAAPAFSFGPLTAPASTWVHFFAGLLFYGFLFLGYLEFYFTADRSITCRILTLIENSPGKRLPSEEILRLYDVRSVMLRRLSDMTYGGYIREKGGDYEMTPKGVRLQRLYGWVIRFLNLGQW